MSAAKRRIAARTPEFMTGNAESAVAMNSLAVRTDVRGSGLSFLRKLARALGFTSSKGPKRPRIAHPVESLIFHNFAIYEIYRGQPGRQYMSLNDVEVLRKLSFRELGGGQCEYRF